MNTLLFSFGKRVFPLFWGTKYTRIHSAPRVWEFRMTSVAIALVSLVRMLGRGRNKASAQRQKSLAHLSRKFEAFRVPSLDVGPWRGHDLPPIDGLWLVHPKDFALLPHSVEAVVQHSLNPLAQVTVISPDPDGAREALSGVTKKTASPMNVVFHADEDYLDPMSVASLDSHFGSSAGWAKQQIIKILAVTGSGFNPTLIMDSDTVLLQDKVWLFPDSRQLMYSREFCNLSYFTFLDTWGYKQVDTTKSFVTHHQIVRSDRMKEALGEHLGEADAATLTRAVITAASTLGLTRFSLDYELYGQYMNLNHRRELVMDKYSNSDLGRPQSNDDVRALIDSMRRAGHFNSLSLHRRD